jgi:tetratricopeptide (TPR) repeat protein
VRLVILSMVLGLLGDVLFPGTLEAETCEEWVAKAESVQGRVEIQRAGKTQWTQVQRHDTFCPGDIIRVRERSRLAIVAQNGSNHRLDENTTLTITPSEQKQTFLLNLRAGAAYFFSRLPRSLQVMTPFANAGVEGTEFFVKVEGDQTFLSVFEGRVAATNPMGSLTLASGQSAIAKAGQAPALRVVVRPRDAVQWALHYPPIIDFRPADFPGEAAWQEMVRQSISFYRKGDLPNAFASMAAAPKDVREPRFFTYRAALLLTVGRVEEARVDIESALTLDPRNSHAFALQSMIAVVQNRKDEALQLATEAVELEPTSSAARVALSYAQQARFDLPGALASLREAVRLSPDDALAWARLAELWLSVGNLKKALDAARRAVVLNPQVARTQTVLGFAFLTQTKIRDATNAFEQAIQLDQTAPLPRLGLGLAQIRQGKLKEGRGEIEIAASLDPNNSIIRSYLGKAYFEEKRDQLARDQFATAKKLDPQDPTPWFYDAIRKQTVNRPVEALQDLQKSIELNDNRAVYRSRLLLDEDLAARSASLGRIYSDLGFQQLALVEGWKSVNVDPSNYSAHRFLADVYAALPRHEIARVSELLQSQLLQPINITPVQPQLAESNLFILDGAGPAAPSFNEFNPLFVRNRLALQASGVVGDNDTFGDELAQSGLWNKFSYSLGQFHFETDGFRKNNDLKTDIYNVFVQSSLSPTISVQAEYRSKDTEHGFLGFAFDLRENIDPFFRRELYTDIIRTGIHYTPAPHSDFIVSAIYQDEKEEQQLAPGDEDTSEVKSKGYITEAQYLLRLSYLNVIVGGSYYDVNNKETFFGEFEEFNVRHGNGYLYSYIRYPSQLTWIVGTSFDSLDHGLLGNFDQLNWKFGMTWNCTPKTTFRLATFRVLRRSLLTDQTIEPTQVAGFNQFFDDTLATESIRHGIALDHRFFSYLFGGLEYSRRSLDVPVGLNGETRIAEEREELYRAYLNWIPHPRFATSAGYRLEIFEAEAFDTRTHFAEVGLRYFHPSGFFSGLETTYVNQDVELTDETIDDQFVLVDAEIGYRLPKRYGIVRLQVRNLFDESFSFQGRNFPQDENPPFLPERTVSVQFTLAF